MARTFQKLTRRNISALNAGQRLTEDGIAVERTASGDLIYRVAAMVDGQRIHRTVGRESDGVTREQAERLIETLRTRAREGRLNMPSGRKNHVSFDEAATEYLRRMEDTGGKNMKSKRYHINHVLKPYFRNERADRVGSHMVQQFVRDRLATGLEQATVNRELATLSHLFRRLAKWGLIKINDIPDIEKGDEPRKKIVVLSEANAEALMKAAVADQDELLWLFVAFGLNAAMRHTEILKVRFDQIDFENRRIFIPEAKAGEREQPITPALTSMLANRRSVAGDKEGYVFPTRRVRPKHPHRQSMAGQFLRAVERAGLSPKEVTPHVMRHTAITRLVRAGVDLPTIQRISGHKTLTMVLRYVHIHGRHIDEGIAAINSPFASVFTQELQMAPSDRGEPDSDENSDYVAMAMA